MAFFIPVLRKVAATIGNNCVLKLPDGISGFQLAQELTGRGTAVPYAEADQMLISPPGKLPVSGVQGLRVLPHRRRPFIMPCFWKLSSLVGSVSWLTCSFRDGLGSISGNENSLSQRGWHEFLGASVRIHLDFLLGN